MPQVIGQLRLERSLQKGLGELLEQPGFPDQIFGSLVVGKQAVQQIFFDGQFSSLEGGGWCTPE